MDVYGEYLFIENFMAGYGIIRLTALMCGRRPSYARMACGAFLCGMFAFILFVNIPGMVESAAEIFFCSDAYNNSFFTAAYQKCCKADGCFLCSQFFAGRCCDSFYICIRL